MKIKFNFHLIKLLNDWIKVKSVSHLNNVVNIMYQPTDAASLGVVRALFGLCMVMDVVEERGFADVDIKWGDPHKCHFPFIHAMEPLSLPWMIVIYSIMWIGAFGIMLGFYFKIACAFFICPYWYLFLLDKSYWNNHTYLYGIVALLFWPTGANKYFAIDAIRTKSSETVAYWNYFALKFQFFILYFLAGLKKGSKEWLQGYAMTNLSNHTVFNIFKLFLTTEQTDLYIVHWFGFFFDLTIGFWMIYEKTRLPAMIVCTAFHLMNSRLFNIGMFPYVCLATMFLFCNPSWPRKVFQFFRSNRNKNVAKNAKMINNSQNCNENNLVRLNTKSDLRKETLTCMKKPKTSSDEMAEESGFPKQNIASKDKRDRETLPKLCNAEYKIKKGQIFVVMVLLCHAIIQFFLPYSHFITEGYNNWVPGLYGYSWDMMVHAWDTLLVIVKVHDNESNIDYYIDPEAWTQNDRWYKHGDMIKQYAHCLKKNVAQETAKAIAMNDPERKMQLNWLSSNISIYIDVWCSLNGRFQQRMFNPNVDLLKANWNVFQTISYLMPLLSELTYYREKMTKIQRDVYSWSNYSDVIFIADFPNMFLENYIPGEVSNVTLTVLEGSVLFIEEDKKEQILSKGFSTKVRTEVFHQIHVISSQYACYMYTYSNTSKQNRDFKQEKALEIGIIQEMKYKMNAWIRTMSWIVDCYLYFVYNVPILSRSKIR